MRATTCEQILSPVSQGHTNEDGYIFSGSGPSGNGNLGLVIDASYATAYVGFHSSTFLSPNISLYTYARFFNSLSHTSLRPAQRITTLTLVYHTRRGSRRLGPQIWNIPRYSAHSRFPVRISVYRPVEKLPVVTSRQVGSVSLATTPVTGEECLLSIYAGKEDGRAERCGLDAAVLGLYGLADVDALAAADLGCRGQAAEQDDDNSGRRVHC